MLKSIVVLIISILIACNPPVNTPQKPETGVSPSSTFEGINLPEGFEISVYADDVVNARSMTLSPNGTLYVGTRGAGNVYALRDTDQDYQVDEKILIYEDGQMPNGVAFKDGDLYVAEVSRILKFEDIDNKLDNIPEPVVVYDKYPTETHHGWKFISFGPDGKLYVPVGAPCNICESEDPIFNTITRINDDGTGLEIVQEGVRNTVGFTWHPQTGDLWFTDNGRDWMGDDMPACELNRAVQDNLHFGYPYCHQGDTPDPDFGTLRDCSEFVAPAQNLGPHVAPLGIEFYTGDMFPEKYKNNVAFIAEHGSWNRKEKIGYRLTMVEFDDQFNAVSYSSFADGWLDEEGRTAWGRPVDIEYLPDGSMLVSDDFADVIYRITYKS